MGRFSVKAVGAAALEITRDAGRKARRYEDSVFRLVDRVRLFGLGGVGMLGRLGRPWLLRELRRVRFV